LSVESSELRVFNEPMNSSKSDARSMELPPKKLHRGDALFGRPGEPVPKRRPLAVLFVERGHADHARQPELHTILKSA
jgi:hypothetical protein